MEQPTNPSPWVNVHPLMSRLVFWVTVYVPARAGCTLKASGARAAAVASRTSSRGFKQGSFQAEGVGSDPGSRPMVPTPVVTAPDPPRHDCVPEVSQWP